MYLTKGETLPEKAKRLWVTDIDYIMVDPSKEQPANVPEKKESLLWIKGLTRTIRDACDKLTRWN